MEELRFYYIWNPGKSPILRKGNLTVRCHPTNNFPFICPGVSSDSGDASKAAGDRERWEQVGTDYDEPPALCGTESDDGEADEGKNEEKEYEDVPLVRSRP